MPLKVALQTLGSFEHAPLYHCRESQSLSGVWLFYTRERAEIFLRNVVSEYCLKGFYMDKTLTPDSFEVIERNLK